MKRGAQILRCAFVGLIASAISLTFYAAGLMELFELDAADLRYHLAAEPERWPDDIVMIYIDQSSLDWMADPAREQIVWPWPRMIHASMAQFLKECGARVVVLDFLMSEPSVRTSESV